MRAYDFNHSALIDNVERSPSGLHLLPCPSGHERAGVVDDLRGNEDRQRLMECHLSVHDYGVLLRQLAHRRRQCGRRLDVLHVVPADCLGGE